jgi:hypothetical protein
VLIHVTHRPEHPTRAALTLDHDRMFTY